jgi:hypothetical protein
MDFFCSVVQLHFTIGSKNKECNNMGTRGAVSSVKYIYQLKEMMIIKNEPNRSGLII